MPLRALSSPAFSMRGNANLEFCDVDQQRSSRYISGDRILVGKYPCARRNLDSVHAACRFRVARVRFFPLRAI
jgi:hypothetical protein